MVGFKMEKAVYWWLASVSLMAVLCLRREVYLRPSVLGLSLIIAEPRDSSAVNCSFSSWPYFDLKFILSELKTIIKLHSFIPFPGQVSKVSISLNCPASAIAC